MSVNEAQSAIGSKEFLKWMWFLKWNATEEFDRKDYYFAQLTAEFRRWNIKHPEKVKIDDFILNFKENKKPSKPKVHESKKFWLGAVGVIGKKRKRQDKRI